MDQTVESIERARQIVCVDTDCNGYAGVQYRDGRPCIETDGAAYYVEDVLKGTWRHSSYCPGGDCPGGDECYGRG
jgi:hypothetical protein